MEVPKLKEGGAEQVLAARGTEGGGGGFHRGRGVAVDSNPRWGGFPQGGECKVEFLSNQSWGSTYKKGDFFPNRE